MIPYSAQPVFIVDPVTQRGWNGAFACFWASGTTNLATVYADAVGTPLANPVQANANGQLPNVWMDDAAALRVSYHPPLASDPSQPDLGTTVWGMDPINSGGGGLSPVTGAAGASRVVTSGDGGAIIRRTHGGVMADTLPAAASVPNGFNVTLWVDADHTDTVTVSGGGTINGAASFVIAARQSVTFFSDGANWYAVRPAITTGRHEYNLIAGALIPHDTNGAGYDKIELATALSNYDAYTFGAAAPEKYVSFHALLPPSVRPGATIGVFFEWTAGAGTAGQTVQWSAAARLLADGDAMDQLAGAWAQATDALIAAGAYHLSPAVSMTPAGSGRRLQGFIWRTAPFGTLAGDARLLGVRLLVDIAASADA